MKYKNNWVVDIVLDERIPEAALILTPNREAFEALVENEFDYCPKEDEIAYTITVIEDYEELTYVVFNSETATLEIVAHESVHLAMRCLFGTEETLLIDEEVEEKLATLTGEITEVIWQELEGYKNK